MDDDDNDFQDEYAARERAGGGYNIGLVGPDGKIDRSLLSPLDKFKRIVDATARGLRDIDEHDIGIMLDNADNLPDVHYKNPTAYVLGYIVRSSSGTTIDKVRFIKIVDRILPTLDILPGTVTAPDIIRYARLWINK